MKLTDIVQRQIPPGQWVEGEKIPWNEPGFSERMLQEHLSQDHDAASRRSALIDQHIAWIHNTILGAQPTKVLDLGCGPGLYSSRLAALGHTCLGIDFSPASVRYATEQASAQQAACTYIHADIRQADFGEGYGLAMLVYGELNVFRREDARHILNKAHAALDDGGRLVLEPHTCDAIRQIGQGSPSWYSSASGLFSAQPHLCLMENFWDEDTRTTTTRYLVLDAATGEVTWHADTMQAYNEDDYRALLTECGFHDIHFYPSLAGHPVEGQEMLCAISARK